MEKNWKKRWMAGAMAFALCCTTLLQTGASAVSAAEVGGVSAQSETQIEVQTETQTETQTEKSEEELIEENLTDVTFNVYAAEAIRAADGVSADYYAADELVGSITTDGNGIAQMDNLPLGRYYIVEKETSHGYVLDNEPRYVDLTYRDQDTPLVTYSADWQNARQRVQVEVLKKEKDSDKVLYGAKEIKEYGSGLLDLPAALFPGRIIGGLYETHKRNHDRGSLPDGTQLLHMYRFWHLLYVPGRCAGI